MKRTLALFLVMLLMIGGIQSRVVKAAYWGNQLSLEPNYTYTFKNTLGKGIRLTNPYNDYVEIIICDENGNYKNAYFINSSEEVTVYQNDIVKIISFDKSGTIRGDSDFAHLVEKSSEPGFIKVHMNYGENYEVKNNTTLSKYICFNRKYPNIDYFTYSDKDVSYWPTSNGTKVESDGGLRILSGSTTRFTCTDRSGIDIYLPREISNSIVRTDKPVHYVATLEVGKTYEFKNTTKSNLSLTLDTNEKFEAIIYENTKNSFNDSTRIVTVDNMYYFNLVDGIGCLERSFKESDGFTIKKKEGSNYTIQIPYELKDLLKEVGDKPVFEKITLPKGKALKYNIKDYKNVSFTTSLMGTYYDENASTLDIVGYNPENNFLEGGYNRKENINSFSSAEVSLNNGDIVDIYVPYEYKDSMEILDRPAVSKIEMKPRAKYKFENKESNGLTVISSLSGYYSGEAYNYIKKGKNGNILGAGKENYYRCILYPGEKITVENLTDVTKVAYIPYILNDTIKEVDYYDEDVNRDTVIDINDLATLGNQYNKVLKDTEYNSQSDLNGDGIIDIFDMTILSKIL